MTLDELNELRLVESEIRSELVRLHLFHGSLKDLHARLSKLVNAYKPKDGAKA